MFDNVVLDPEAANGFVIKRKYMTIKSKTGGGAEERRQKWLVPHYEIMPPYESMHDDQFLALQDFSDLRGGDARSFPMWNPFECYCATAQALGTGDGANKNFQLVRIKTDAANTLTIKVLHPVPTGTAIPRQYQGSFGHTTASILVKVDGVAKTEITDYTVDPLTGIVAFGTAPAAGKAVTAEAFWYYTTVRFDGDEFEVDLNGILGKSGPKLVGCPFE